MGVTPTMPAKKTSTGKPPATNPKAAPPATKSKAAAKKSPGESKKAPNPGQVALDAKLAAEAAEKDALAQKAAALDASCSGKEWQVCLSDVPKALQKAEGAGKTPLLLDSTEHNAVDTFYSYQMAQVIEGKKLVMKGRDPAGLAAVMEEARTLLVQAMAKGYALYLRMTNCAADVTGKYQDAQTLPVEVWDRLEVEKVLDAELTGSPFEGVVREADTDEYGGVDSLFVHKDFRVIVCSQFKVEDYEEFLARALPLEKMQPIVVTGND